MSSRLVALLRPLLRPLQLPPTSRLSILIRRRRAHDNPRRPIDAPLAQSKHESKLERPEKKKIIELQEALAPASRDRQCRQVGRTRRKTFSNHWPGSFPGCGFPTSQLLFHDTLVEAAQIGGFLVCSVLSPMCPLEWDEKATIELLGSTPKITTHISAVLRSINR